MCVAEELTKLVQCVSTTFLSRLQKYRAGETNKEVFHLQVNASNGLELSQVSQLDKEAHPL